MVDSLALARSFYAWLAKVHITEVNGHVRDVVPKCCSTDPAALRPITQRLVEVVRGTKYEDRAIYWQAIFEDFSSSSVLPLEERRAIFNFMRKLFLPPPPKAKLPSDSYLVNLSRTALRKLYKAGEELQVGRKGLWTYKYFEKLRTEDELDMMANALGYTASEADLKDASKRNWAFRWRLFVYSINPFSGPRWIRAFAQYGVVTPIEYTIAMLVYLMRKAFGPVVTKKVVDDIFQSDKNT